MAFGFWDFWFRVWIALSTLVSEAGALKHELGVEVDFAGLFLRSVGKV